MRYGLLLVSALLMSSCATGPQASLQQPSAARGERLAQDLCAGCHAVSDSRPRANPNAPPFSSFLATYEEERMLRDLQSGALMGHPPLPTVRLSEAGARDLVAYLKTLSP